MKKINGYVCDNSHCRKFFTVNDDNKLITGHGAKRILHFCTLKCKAIWVKKRNF